MAFADSNTFSITVQAAGFTPPYALPSAGQAVALTVSGGNNAMSVTPTGEGWNTTSWDYSNFGSYGGGAFVPKYSTAGTYVIAGTGGHDHPDNHGALVFDFTTGLWSRLDNAHGVARKPTYPHAYSVSEGTGSPWHEIPGTPIPLPPHPYNLICYDPTGNKGSIIHITRAGLGSEIAFAQVAHRFDLETRLWSRASTGESGRVATVSSTALWDEPRNRWWWIGERQHEYNSVSYIDRADSTWKTTANQTGTPSDSLAGYKSSALIGGKIIVNRGSSLWYFDPDLASAGWSQLLVSGTMPINLNTWAPYSDGRYYSMPIGGGNTITRITPPADLKNGTWLCESVSIGGASLPNGSRGPYAGLDHYKRFLYVPAIDCLAWIPGGSESVYLLKP